MVVNQLKGGVDRNEILLGQRIGNLRKQERPVFTERSHGQAAQAFTMTARSQRLPDVTSQASNVRPLAAVHVQFQFGPVVPADLKAIHINGPGG